MHNLIMSRAVFEILKKPLPHALRLYQENNIEDCERDGELAAKSESAGLEDESADSSTLAKLNVNAREFVPRFKGNMDDEAGEVVDMPLKARKPMQPKLLLPWKGFPKPMRPERANKSRKLTEPSFSLSAGSL